MAGGHSLDTSVREQQVGVGGGPARPGVVQLGQGGQVVQGVIGVGRPVGVLVVPARLVRHIGDEIREGEARPGLSRARQLGEVVLQVGGGLRPSERPRVPGGQLVAGAGEAQVRLGEAEAGVTPVVGGAGQS